MEPRASPYRISTGKSCPDCAKDLIVDLKARGIQLNACARVAAGDVLLFLHADARLPPAGRDAILCALANPRIIGGNFLPRFLPASRFTRFLEPSNDIRRLITRRYYGDWGIFVRREIYHCRLSSPCGIGR